MEYAALLCIIVPCIISFFAGYAYALYRTGLVKITRSRPVSCAACGHAHKGGACGVTGCECMAFVEDHER